MTVVVLFNNALTLSTGNAFSKSLTKGLAMSWILPLCILLFPLQMIQDDLAELAIQMEEVEKLVQSNATHRHEMNQLLSDIQALKRSLEVT